MAHGRALYFVHNHESLVFYLCLLVGGRRLPRTAVYCRFVSVAKATMGSKCVEIWYMNGWMDMKVQLGLWLRQGSVLFCSVSFRLGSEEA